MCYLVCETLNRPFCYFLICKYITSAFAALMSCERQQIMKDSLLSVEEQTPETLLKGTMVTPMQNQAAFQLRFLGFLSCHGDPLR